MKIFSRVYNKICSKSLSFVQAVYLWLRIQGDQKVCVHLMITMQ
jgi:hypothetical protein